MSSHSVRKSKTLDQRLVSFASHIARTRTLYRVLMSNPVSVVVEPDVEVTEFQMVSLSALYSISQSCVVFGLTQLMSADVEVMLDALTVFGRIQLLLSQDKNLKLFTCA